VIAKLHIHLASTRLFDTIAMLALLAGGLESIARALLAA